MTQILTQYEVSFILRGDSASGAIIESTQLPAIGERLSFGGKAYEVVDVAQLMPPIDRIGFVQAVCTEVREH